MENQKLTRKLSFYGNRFIFVSLFLLILSLSACSITTEEKTPIPTSNIVFVTVTPSPTPTVPLVQTPTTENLVAEVPTNTLEPRPTDTTTPNDTPTPTNTTIPTNTPTAIDTATPTATQTPIPTNTATPTRTPKPTSTHTATPTRTPRPTPTHTTTPTRTPRPTSTHTATPTTEPSLLSNLKNELFFGAGGGNNGCMAFPPLGTNLPAVEFLFMSRETSSGTICLGGFPINEAVTVNLYAPDGNSIALDTFFAEYERNGAGVIQIFLWLPAILPSGKWTLTATSASDSLTSHFYLEPYNLPSIMTIPSSGINIFEGEKYLLDNFYLSGEQIEILGVNFRPNQNIPLGIYYYESLVYGEIVTTDSNGSFYTAVVVDTNDPPGLNYIVAVINPYSNTAPGNMPYDIDEHAGPNAYFHKR